MDDTHSCSDFCPSLRAEPLPVQRCRRFAAWSRNLAFPVAPNIVDHCLNLMRFLASGRSAGPQGGPREAHRRLGAGRVPQTRELERYVARRLGHCREESLLCLFYGADGVSRAESVFAGTVSQIVASRAGLAAEAARHGAQYVVIAHNHPSGTAEPSGQDVLATRQVFRLFSALGMTLADHLIVAGGGRCFSFRAAGLL